MTCRFDGRTERGPSARGGGFAAALLVLAFAALPAGAMTLADLVDGGSMLVEGVSYSDFEAKVKGKGLSRDLEDYLVEAGDGGGLVITLALGEKPGKKGKLLLDYEATSGELIAAVLTVQGSDGSLKAKQKLLGEKKLGKLKVKDDPGSNDAHLLLDDGPTRVAFQSKIKSKDGGIVTAGVESAIPVPEPATAVLMGGGLLGLALAGRRRARS